MKLRLERIYEYLHLSLATALMIFILVYYNKEVTSKLRVNHLRLCGTSLDVE